VGVKKFFDISKDIKFKFKPPYNYCQNPSFTNKSAAHSIHHKHFTKAKIINRHINRMAIINSFNFVSVVWYFFNESYVAHCDLHLKLRPMVGGIFNYACIYLKWFSPCGLYIMTNYYSHSRGSKTYVPVFTCINLPM